MITCRKCGGKFATSAVINGRRHYLNKRKYCLKCSPFGIRNRKRLEFWTNSNTDGVIICHLCKKEKSPEDFYARNKNGKLIRGECKECAQKDRKKRMIKFKQACVDHKGGSCQICGYCRCLRSMDFHHIDPSKKDFAISDMRFGYNVTEVVKKELDKCVLVCRNCHGEVHEGLVDCPVDVV